MTLFDSRCVIWKMTHGTFWCWSSKMYHLIPRWHMAHFEDEVQKCAIWFPDGTFWVKMSIWKMAHDSSPPEKTKPQNKQRDESTIYPLTEENLQNQNFGRNRVGVHVKKSLSSSSLSQNFNSQKGRLYQWFHLSQLLQLFCWYWKSEVKVILFRPLFCFAVKHVEPQCYL